MRSLNINEAQIKIRQIKLDEYLNEALAMPYKWLKKNAEEIVKKRDYCDTDPDINCN